MRKLKWNGEKCEIEVDKCEVIVKEEGKDRFKEVGKVRRNND